MLHTVFCVHQFKHASNAITIQSYPMENAYLSVLLVLLKPSNMYTLKKLPRLCVRIVYNHASNAMDPVYLVVLHVLQDIIYYRHSA